MSCDPRLRRIALVALLVAASLVGCRGAERAEGRRVILILLDAARPDRFSTYGYDRETTPHMDRLASRGIVFENHYAQGTSTRESLPSLLFSRYFTLPLFPGSTAIPLTDPASLFRTLDAEAVSTPQAFARAGFRTVAVSAHTWTREGTRFADEFDELHDLPALLPYDRRYGYPRAEQVVDYALDLLSDSADEDLFLYLHLMDTHFPHFLEKDARRWFGKEPVSRRFAPGGGGKPARIGPPLDERERQYLDALYDGSLRYTDRHLGRLFDHLEASGRLDDAVVVITSDHGEHLLEQPDRFTHGGPWYELVARIPLILFHPAGLEPGRYRGLSEGVDVQPTLLRLAGITPPEGKRPDGVDLLSLLEGARPPKSHALHQRGIRSSDQKLLFAGDSHVEALTRDSVDVGGVRLFDLQEDPDELHDLAAERPAAVDPLVTTFRNRLRGPYRRFLRAVTTEPPPRPFAVGAHHATTDRPTPRGPTEGAPIAHLLGSVGDDGWIRLMHWQLFGLLAREGAEPLRLEMPIPSGDYSLSAYLQGAARLVFADGTQCELSSLRGVDRRECGNRTVDDMLFTVRVEPVPGTGPLLLKSFGFAPLGGAVEGEDEDALERLRALGYLQ